MASITKKTRNVAIEVQLKDGSVSLLTGRLLKSTPKTHTLDQAAFVKDTGRRTEFFSGRFDSNCEIEVYPDAMEIELPAEGAMIYSWPHPLPRTVR